MNTNRSEYNRLVIGTVTVSEAREITHNHTYYAADSRTVRLIPGEYPVRLTLQGGYLFPMPYWVCYGVDCDVIDESLYSGFGGNNFAVSRPEPHRSKYTVQAYDYQLKDFGPELAFDSRLPEPELLKSDSIAWAKKHVPTWDAARALAATLNS